GQPVGADSEERDGHADDDPTMPTANEPAKKVLRNFEMVKKDGTPAEGGDDQVKIGLAAATIHADMLTVTREWPKRVGPLLFARDGDSPIYFERAANLFAWINGLWLDRRNA